MSDSNFPRQRTAVIQEIIHLTREQYVYPDAGERIAAHIRANLDAGVYDPINDPADLAVRLTVDLRAISNDQHWSVTYNPQAAGSVDPETDPDRLSAYLERARKANFGFRSAEVLKGNVGYLAIDYFHRAEYGGETAVAAMNFVAGCNALIIDVRKNHGGYPSMVQLVTSYLFDPEPRHLNTFYYRPTDSIQQFWTLPHVPGRRRPDIPVYVLTSQETGSCPEEFAYNLKHMDRAILVGETTLGAAHPVTRIDLGQDFELRLPYGRPINPVTGTNWEGTGVAPHIPVSAEDALQTAHLKALERLASNHETAEEKNDLAWLTEIIQKEYAPIDDTKMEIDGYAGVYGKRQFFVENNNLMYRHESIPVSWRLLPMSKDRFCLDVDMKFEFLSGEGDGTSSVRIEFRDGRVETVMRQSA